MQQEEGETTLNLKEQFKQLQAEVEVIETGFGTLTCYGEIGFPTVYGKFQQLLFEFSSTSTGETNQVICLGKNLQRRNEVVITRVHSACKNGDVFGGLSCECGRQKEEFLKFMQDQDGLTATCLLYFPEQEGRSNQGQAGLRNKFMGYRLHQRVLPFLPKKLGEVFGTKQIYEAMDLDYDTRDYAAAAAILESYFQAREILLFTANPEKQTQVGKYLSADVDLQPFEMVISDLAPEQRHYLEHKARYAGHQSSAVTPGKTANTI